MFFNPFKIKNLLASIVKNIKNKATINQSRHQEIQRPLLGRTVFLTFFNHRANFSIADGFFNLWDIHLHKYL